MENWFRGMSSNAAPKVGAAVGGHVPGDGVWYTDRLDVAQRHADLRVSTSGGQGRIVRVDVTRAEPGRVLDLTRDPRWRTFLDTPQMPGRPASTPRALIRRANQSYPILFDAFVQLNKIDLSRYDAVIAEEFVRGGKQLCIRHVAGQPSPLARTLESRWLAPSAPQTSAAAAAIPTGKLIATQSAGSGPDRGQRRCSASRCRREPQPKTRWRAGRRSRD